MRYFSSQPAYPSITNSYKKRSQQVMLAVIKENDLRTYPITEVKEITSAALVSVIALRRATDVDFAPVDSLKKTGKNRTS